MLFYTLEKVLFFAFLFLTSGIAKNLFAKKQKRSVLMISYADDKQSAKVFTTHKAAYGTVPLRNPTSLSLKNLNTHSSEAFLPAGLFLLPPSPPLGEEGLEKSVVDYIFIVGILLLQIAIIIIYFLHRKNLAKRRQLTIKNQTILKFQIALTEHYIEKEKTKQKELKQQLELTHKKLTSYTFNYQQKNKIINQLQEIVEKLESTTSTIEKKNLLSTVKKLTKENLTIDKAWEYFRDFFEETQFGFNAKLLSKHPKLKPNDLKLCALIRLNLNIKETANILGISPGSVKTSRHRLRQKLDLAPKEEIIDYLIRLETENFAPPPAKTKKAASKQNSPHSSPVSKDNIDPVKR